MLWMLKRFCDEHDLDPQEIDDTLTYWENKEHLKSLLAYVDPGSNHWRDVDLWRAEEERYRAEHFLHYYIMCARAGETKPKDVGPPIESTGFSLTAYIQSQTFFCGVSNWKTIKVLCAAAAATTENMADSLGPTLSSTPSTLFECWEQNKDYLGDIKNDLPCYQIFHNFIREHEGLDGKTPAEACGITIEGKNKWKTLIQNASQQNR